MTYDRTSDKDWPRLAYFETLRYSTLKIGDGRISDSEAEALGKRVRVVRYHCRKTHAASTGVAVST